jgi:hypothetical protein
MDVSSTTWYDPVKQRCPTWCGAENTSVGVESQLDLPVPTIKLAG